MTESKLDRWTQYAAILGALVTAGSMVFGVLTFRRTSEEQRQSMALGVLQDYLKLSVEHPDLASFEEGERVDIRHAWFAANALFTAQTLWKLQGDDPRWERIIKAIIRDYAQLSGARQVGLRRVRAGIYQVHKNKRTSIEMCGLT